MVYDIKVLVESEYDFLKDIGKLLYDRENQNGGLTLDETCKLLMILTNGEVEKEYQDAYNEGFNDGQYE